MLPVLVERETDRENICLGKLGVFGSSEVLGRMGIKRLDIFSKALAAKLRWQLLNNHSLWTKVAVSKYISPSNAYDWIRQDHRNNANISIIWKAVISTKDLLRNGLTWRIRSGSQVQLGIDPSVGCGNAHRLFEGLRAHLLEQGITNISHIADEVHSSLFEQAWKIVHDLNILQRWQQEWRDYTKALTEVHIKITEGDDELIWAFAKHGVYSSKIGYQVLMESHKPPSSEQWWKHLWKLKAAPWTRLFMWSILRNKVPTGANLMTQTISSFFALHSRSLEQPPQFSLLPLTDGRVQILQTHGTVGGY